MNEQVWENRTLPNNNEENLMENWTMKTFSSPSIIVDLNRYGLKAQLEKFLTGYYTKLIKKVSSTSTLSTNYSK